MSKDKYPVGLVCLCGQDLVVFKYERFADDRDTVTCKHCNREYLPKYEGATSTPVYREPDGDHYQDFEGEILYGTYYKQQ